MDGTTPLFHYVLAEGDLEEDMMEELIENLHPEGELEEGWEIVSIEGTIEEGEAEAGGFIAVHDGDDLAYLCDEGSIRKLSQPASKLTIIEGHD